MARHSKPPDRTKIQAWAQSMFALPNFYVLDTETTGLNKTDEVVQIGIIDKNGEIVLDTLVKPTKRVPPQASNIHGITNKMLADESTFDDIYVSLSTKLAGMPLIAYNMDFDWRLLSQTANNYKLPLFRTGKRHCAMKQYAQFRGVRGSRGYKWHKLADAATYEKIIVKDAHTALGDVIMTLELMKKMAE